MRNSRPKYINKYIVPRDILRDTLTHLLAAGVEGHEGYLCWSGINLGNDNVLIRSCIYPKSFRSLHSAWVDLGSAAFDIGQQVAARGELIFAQVHSHPGAAFHSETDNKYPISHQKGFISLVVPNYAKGVKDSLRDCRVYEYQGSAMWRALSHAEVNKRFKIEGILWKIIRTWQQFMIAH